MKFLPDKLYNPLKFIAQIALPAAGTLYFALAGIWHLPSPEEILGTIIAVDTFLGVLLGISSNSADYAGDLNVSQQEGKTVFSLDLNYPPEELLNKQKVSFKVLSR